MKLIDCLRSIQVSPRTAFLSIGLLAILCAGAVVTARNRAASLPERSLVNAKEVFAAAASKKVESMASAAASKKAEPAASKANPDSTAQKTKEKKEKGPYDVIKQRNLFRPLGSTVSPRTAPKALAGTAGKSSAPVDPMPVQPIPSLPVFSMFIAQRSPF